jgi:DNA-directed RNA polymerase subunit K/omega
MKRNDDSSEMDLTEMTQQGGGKYFLVNVLAKRAKALDSGGKPLVKVENGCEVDNIAIEEVRRGKISVKPKKRTPKMVDIIETNNK